VKDFFSLGHADLALQSSRRLCATNAVALPDNCWCDNCFEFLSDFVAGAAISTMLSEMLSKRISPSVSA